MRLCLDTSAYTHFKRGHRPVVELIDGADWIGMSAVVLGELRTGFALGTRARHTERELAAFLRNPVVHRIDIDDDCSRIYAEIVHGLRRSGTPLPTNDIWIASCAARAGAIVLTYDAHFEVIGRVGSQVLARSNPPP